MSRGLKLRLQFNGHQHFWAHIIITCPYGQRQNGALTNEKLPKPLWVLAVENIKDPYLTKHLLGLSSALEKK